MVDIHWFLMVLRSLTKLKEISEMEFKSPRPRQLKVLQSLVPPSIPLTNWLIQVNRLLWRSAKYT